jgi:hypothetical protein
MTYEENIILFINKQKITEQKKCYFISFLQYTPIESDNLTIYYTKDYETNLNEDLINELYKNIEYAKQYKTYNNVNEARNNILFLKDDRFKDQLKIRETKFKEVIQKDECNFLGLLNNKINDTNDFFKLFTFDFNNLFKKEHIQTIFNLTKLFNKGEINGIFTKQNIIDNNLWKIPSFNTPRDIILSNEKSLEEFVEELYISPEYRLMKLLLENKIINNNFKDDEIDYILSVYRCCFIGDNFDLELFKPNSKFFDSTPYISSYDRKLNFESQKFCKDNPELTWNPLNNILGVHIAAMRTIIFPFMTISNNLNNRYENIPYDHIKEKPIGIFILNFQETYIILNIRIIDNKLKLFDIYDNLIHLKDSAISFQRCQLLECKWAINRLVSLLEHSKVMPYKEKECDIIVFKINKKVYTNKDIYLFSLYNKIEILEMYNNLEKAINTTKNIDINKKNQISCLIQTFIDELNMYEEIINYRFHKKIMKNNILTLFLWEINPKEIHLWNYTKNKKSKLGKIDNCIKSELYVNIKTDEESYEKQEFNFEINDIQNVSDKFYKSVKYHQDDEYKKKIEKYKSTMLIKYNKYKIKYLKLKYNI